jgi:hypothetical protein
LRVVRWLLVPASAFGVWVAVLLAGLGGVNLLDSLCPPDLMISGLCTAWWHQPAMTLLESACAGIAAAGVVLIPALVAPGYRIQVAAIFFAAGAVFATALAGAGGMWGPLLTAAVTGTAALYAGMTRWRRGRSGRSE